MSSSATISRRDMIDFLSLRSESINSDTLRQFTRTSYDADIRKSQRSEQSKHCAGISED